MTQNRFKKKNFLEGESLDVLYRGLNRNKEKSSLFKQEIEFFSTELFHFPDQDCVGVSTDSVETKFRKKYGTVIH